MRLSCMLLTGLLCSPAHSIVKPATNPYATELAREESPYATQRQQYLQAEKAFREKRLWRFKQLSKGLKDYPLYPYLEYKRYNRQLNTLNTQQASDFLNTYDETVVGDWLRSKLIRRYAKQQQWQSLIDIYRPGYGIEAECRYLEALVHTQKASLAYPRIESLWLHPSSQPEQCDRVFELWEAEGYKTPELVWQRFKLAISDGNRSLAKYLSKSLPDADARVARKWLSIHRRPQNSQIEDIRQLQHPEQVNIMAHWLKRLSSRDIDKAIAALQALKNYPFNAHQQADITRRIGLVMARRHMPEAGIWLSRVPASHTDKQVREWRIRTAIRQGDWSHVIQGISQLETTEQNRQRWQYWWAYANEELGNINDALGIYQHLAAQRSYYGFLSADRLGQDYNFKHRPVEPDNQTMEYVRLQDETIRAREFYLMDKLLPARREWQRLIRRLNTEQKLAASKLAQLWGWHDRAIVTMGQTRYRDDIELRFPLHLSQKVHNWSSRHNIEPAWTYAIIRRESAFVTDARSSVGAMGLMQLMPNTARHMARHLKMRYQGYKTLLASNTNIRLGTGYLERMLEKLNQQVLATAAYNAGPHRVEKWLPEHRSMDAMRWIETIPFTETREYVSNVLAYMAIYEHRLQRDITPLSQRMPPVPARNAPAITESEQPPNQPTAQAENQAENNAG